jgi:hypothetical protein
LHIIEIEKNNKLIKKKKDLSIPHIQGKLCGSTEKLYNILLCMRRGKDGDEFKELDKQWKKYRKENELDAYGDKNKHNNAFVTQLRVMSER